MHPSQCVIGDENSFNFPTFRSNWLPIFVPIAGSSAVAATAWR